MSSQPASYANVAYVRSMNNGTAKLCPPGDSLQWNGILGAGFSKHPAVSAEGQISEVVGN